MSAEQNKAVVRQWIENGWNKGNVNLIDDLYTPDVVQHDPATPIPVTNAEALKQYIGGFLHAMPDMHFTTGDLLAEGDANRRPDGYSAQRQNGNCDGYGAVPAGKREDRRGVGQLRRTDHVAADGCDPGDGVIPENNGRR